MNVTLLAKWLWRLKCEYNSLWSSCITCFHNISSIYGKPLAKCRLQRIWFSISKFEVELEDWYISFNNLLERKIGAGDNTYFWKDHWIDNKALNDVFPKLYLIKTQKNCKIVERIHIHGAIGQWH